MKCQARQHSDQMICHKCGLVWDMNDPDPPVCVTTVRHPATSCSAVSCAATPEMNLTATNRSPGATTNSGSTVCRGVQNERSEIGIL